MGVFYTQALPNGSQVLLTNLGGTIPMKTINMLAETIQMILGGIQQFAKSFNVIGEMTHDAVDIARKQQLAEYDKHLTVN